MGRADVGRSKHVPFRSAPERGQVGEHGIKPARGKQPWDVLQEDVTRSNVAKDPDDVRPDPPLVLDAAPLAGGAVRLAGETGSDEIHAATPRATVEGGDVRPDRRRIQLPVFHARRQHGSGIGFPLHVTDGAMSGHRKADSEVEAAAPGT